MINIDKETYENNNIEAIVDSNNILWLNEKPIEKKLDNKHLPAITNKYDQMYKKHRHELINEPKNNQMKDFYIVI